MPKPFSSTSLMRLLALACLAFSTGNVVAHPANQQPSARYEIPAGSLDEALRAFASQSNLQLIYSSLLVRGKQSPGLHGDFTPTGGLARLLAEHGLTAVAASSNTYLLQGANKPTFAPAAATLPQTAIQTHVTELASVDVTGTRIPRTSLELTFPMTVITADDIERSGRTTLHDLLAEQPGLVSHQPIAVARENQLQTYPMVAPTGASLYSLGPRATLYLIDGRRAAQYGLASSDLGGIVDLGAIPLDFVERIEILREGASAVYGADAMAGTVNIILKKDYSGSEISYRSGVSQRGDAHFRKASAIHGMRTRWGGEFLLAASSSSQDELAGERRDWHTLDGSRFGLPDRRPLLGFFTWNSQLLLPLPQCQAAGGNPDSPYCRFDTERYRTLQPALRNTSFYARWDQELGDSFSFNLSALRTESEQTLQHQPGVYDLTLTPAHPDYAKAPVNTDFVYYPLYELGGARNHSQSVTHHIAANLGGSASEWHWNIGLSHSENGVRSHVDNVYLRSKYLEMARRLRIDGSDNADLMNSVRDSIDFSGAYSVDSLEATSNRRIFDAPGGPVQLEWGVSFHSTRRRNTPDPRQIKGELSSGAIGIKPYNLRSRDSAMFAEIDLPLHRALQADVAIRLDRYRGFKTRISPRFGIKWNPGDSIVMRASVGQGYRPPGLNDERVPFDRMTYPRRMRIRPGLLPCIQDKDDPRYCVVEYGVGENPRLRPEFSRSLTAGILWAPTQEFSIGLDSYRIQRTNEFGIADAFSNPAIFVDGLVRDANGVLYRVNRYLANIGKSEIRGWELESNYLLRKDTFGQWRFRVTGHYLAQHITTSAMQRKPVDHAGHDTPKLTLHGSAEWRRGSWASALSLHRFSSSRAYPAGGSCPPSNRIAGRCNNPPVTLLGLTTSYQARNGWSYSFSVNNLLDRDPVNYRAYSDGYNIGFDDVLGRYFSLGATFRF